jgi:hypothetical protein
MNNNVELGQEDIHDEPFIDEEIRTHFLETLGVTLNTANGETMLNNIIHNHLDEANDNDPIVPPPIGTVFPIDYLEPHEQVGLSYRYSDAKFGSYMSKSLSPKLRELLKEQYEDHNFDQDKVSEEMPANYRPRVNACNPMNISPEDIAYLELLTILKSFEAPIYAFERVNKWVRYLIKHKILQHGPEGETVTFSTKRDTYMKKLFKRFPVPPVECNIVELEDKDGVILCQEVGDEQEQSGNPAATARNFSKTSATLAQNNLPLQSNNTADPALGDNSSSNRNSSQPSHNSSLQDDDISEALY